MLFYYIENDHYIINKVNISREQNEKQFPRYALQ